MKGIPILDIFSQKPEPQPASGSYVDPVSGQSPLEEIVNSSTHGLGLALSIAGLSVLVVFASIYGTAWHVISCAIYGATLVLLYGASTCYHAVRSVEGKRSLRTVEQAFIFLLIAGTYTPFTLAALNAEWGWSLFGVVWGLAVTGVILNTLYFQRLPSNFKPRVIFHDRVVKPDCDSPPERQSPFGRTCMAALGRGCLHHRDHFPLMPQNSL